MRAEELIDAVLEVSSAICYVAIHPGVGEPVFRGRFGTRSSVHDERLLNPALLDLARRSGNGGDGALDYVLLRFHDGYTLLLSHERDYIAIGLTPESDPVALWPLIKLAAQGQLSRGSSRDMFKDARDTRATAPLRTIRPERH
jgi:hypothetical protein